MKHTKRWPLWILALSFWTAGSSAFAAFSLPQVESLELSNGLKVFLIQQSEVPLVHMTLTVRGGSASDGQAWGLSALTADALALGTASKKKSVIEETLDFYGVEYESSASRDYVQADMSLASADLDKLVPLFAEIITKPQFPEQEVEKLRERTSASLKKAKESPNRIASELFSRLLFSQHPYGTPTAGTSESVKKMKRADLLKYHQTHFVPNRSALAVVGSFDAMVLKKLLQDNFGSWKAGPPMPVSKLDEVPIDKVGQVFLVDKPDSHETTLRIGGRGIPRNNKDWIELQVVNTVLGGRFTSLLNDELRTKSGLTYGARSGFDGWKDSGLFVVSTFTATKTSFETLDLTLKTYQGYLKNGLDQKTLLSAKAYVKGQFPPVFETSESLAQLLGMLWVHGIPVADFNSFDSRVDGLTLERANELIKAYFPRDNLDILLIGKASDLSEKAKTYGTVKALPIDRIDQVGTL